MQPPPRLSPDKWAAANRTYPKSAAIPGPRNPYLTPYIIEPMRAVAERRAKRVVMVTAAQAGKSDSMLDLIGHRLDQKPAPVLYVGPNKQFLSEQFEPRIMGLLDEAPALAMKVARGKRMTKTRKVVNGVPLRLAHAGSASALKSDPAALALIDEFDGMVENVHAEGNPVALVERRGDTYPGFCCFVVSTPKVGIVRVEKDAKSGLQFWAIATDREDVQSPIWALWQQGTRHHWAWPCPHCSEYFVPRFDRLRYDEKLPMMQAAESAYVECPRCGGVITDAHKAAMNAEGRYVAPGQTVGKDGIVRGDPVRVPTLSFWVSGLCSPFVTFADRALTYIESLQLGDDAMVQAAVSSAFGELYTPGGVNINQWETVAARRQPYKFGEVLAEIVKITCAIDVQKTSLVYSVRGWGQRASSWQIESGELHGFTDEPQIWNDASDLAMTLFAGMPINLLLIDSGFRPDKPEHNTIAVNVIYDWARRHRANVRPTKGYAVLDAPIKKSKLKVLTPGHKIASTIELLRLDSDFWKSRVHLRLAWPEDQPGAFLLSEDATDAYCKSLVSEVRRLNEKGKPEWIRISRQNHYLDCEAMNEAAGHVLNVSRIPLGTMRHIADEPEETVTAAPPVVRPVPSAASPVYPPPPLTPQQSSARDRMRALAERLRPR